MSKMNIIAIIRGGLKLSYLALLALRHVVLSNGLQFGRGK